MTDISPFLQPGARAEIGTVLFSKQDIMRFAEKYDPQVFHLDEEAAVKTMPGGLCASGWHTASSWMRLQRKFVEANCQKLKKAGQPFPEFGPSPGFQNLRWAKPVYAGDTVTYWNEVESERESKSRPGWSILSVLTEGKNQHDELVISFQSTVFVKFGQQRKSALESRETR